MGENIYTEERKKKIDEVAIRMELEMKIGMLLDDYGYELVPVESDGELFIEYQKVDIS